MNEDEIPVHTGAYLLRSPRRRNSRVFRDFQRVGIETFLVHEDRFYEDVVRHFFHEFFFTRGVMDIHNYIPEKWVTFVVGENFRDMTPYRFSVMMGVTPGDDGNYLYSDSLKFDEFTFDDSGEEVDEVLGETLNEEDVEDCLDNERVNVEHISRDLFLHYRVIRENITCRNMWYRTEGQHPVDSVTVMEALILFWIIRGRRMNMGFIMASVIQDAVSVYPTRPIPYGMRLTHLFRRMNLLTEEDGSGTVVPRL